MSTQPENTHGIQTHTQPNPYPKFGSGPGITLGYPNFGNPILTIIQRKAVQIKFWVWVGLGLCPISIGIFGLGTHKVQNFGFFRVLPLGTQEYWVPKIRAPKGNTRTVL